MEPGGRVEEEEGESRRMRKQQTFKKFKKSRNGKPYE
jgi:hypothetical protein